jgi:hypothetical protein
MALRYGDVVKVKWPRGTPGWAANRATRADFMVVGVERSDVQCIVLTDKQDAGRMAGRDTPVIIHENHLELVERR